MNLWNGEALNYLTGRSSDNEATASVNQLLTVLNDNGVDISNILAAHATSGANTASDNTGNATVSTGDASLLSTLFNMANTNIFGANSVNILYQDIYGNYNGNIDLSSASPYSLINLSQDPLTFSSANNKTGSSSDNAANIQGSMTFDVLNQNDGNLVNDWDLSAVTGNNTADDNTGNATIDTGNADIIGNLINMLNTNIFTNEFYFGVINVYGNWLGNLILPEYPTSSSGYTGDTNATVNNTMTGSTSTNDANVDISKDLTNTNTNTGTVNGNYNLLADTGSNSASDNTMGGSVTSGNTYGEANVANWLNTNVTSDAPWWLIMVNNLGTWVPILQNTSTGAMIVLDIDALGLSGTGGQSATGGIDANAQNEMTGSNSTNDAAVDLSLTGNVTNNNTGTITNNVDASAITGGNTADRNTGEGLVTTGDASIWLNVLNFLNTNISAPSVMLTIVNIFGSWTGDVLHHGAAASIPTTTTTTTTTTTSSGVGGCGACLSTNNAPPPSQNNTTNNNSNSQNNTSNSSAASTGGQSSGGTGGTGASSYVSYVSNQGGSGQVLSFSSTQEDKDETAGNNSSAVSGFQFAPLQNIAFGFILGIAFIVLYIARRKARVLLPLLLKVRTISLF